MEGVSETAENAPRPTPENHAPPAECDVLIVGAGPAGSAAATWLARRGIDVVL
ncbi:FAD-dependent monooxygenase, partial [Dietzia timorensis]